MLQRRQFCASALGAAALVAAGRASSAAAPQGAELLRAYRRMRYADGPGMAIGWLRAKRLAISEGKVVPVCGMLAASFSKLHEVSDGGFEVVTMEITHYTDYETGDLLESLVMPFSGVEVEVPPFRSGPALVRTAPLLDESERYAPREATSESAFAPAGTVLMTKSLEVERIERQNLLLRHEEYGRVYPDESEQPSLFYRESTLWSAPLAAATDPAREWVDSTVFYSAMTSWRPWMHMGDLPGHTASNGFGYRAATIDDLPADYLRYTRQRHPGVLERAGELLDEFAAGTGAGD